MQPPDSAMDFDTLMTIQETRGYRRAIALELSVLERRDRLVRYSSVSYVMKLTLHPGAYRSTVSVPAAAVAALLLAFDNHPHSARLPHLLFQPKGHILPILNYQRVNLTWPHTANSP